MCICVSFELEKTYTDRLISNYLYRKIEIKHVKDNTITIDMYFFKFENSAEEYYFYSCHIRYTLDYIYFNLCVYTNKTCRLHFNT